MIRHTEQFIVCHDCDLLQREIPLKRGCTASCRRCGAVLYRNATDSIGRTLAYILAAAVLFLIANLYPLLSIEIQGVHSSITLLGAVRSLWHQQMPTIALLVFLTAILIPALQLISMICLLLPLHFYRIPVGYAYFLRLLQISKQWGMIEVLMLGILVSLVKLSSSFTVVSGVALWSFGCLTLLLAAAAASFSTRDVWARLEQSPCGERDVCQG